MKKSVLPMPHSDSPNLTAADLLKGDLQLTSPPAIYFELKKTIEDPYKSIIDAGEIINKDPALSIRLLKLVNSAFFGFPSRIVTISHAITLIGTQELQNLVLSTLIIDRFSMLPNGMLSMHDFWAMSLRSALTAKELAAHWDTNENDEAIFICGLLHEIGKLVFYRRIPELAREVGLLVESTNADEIETERSIIGFDHYETGAELAKLWKLPEIISETIALHAHPDSTGRYQTAAAIVRSANRIAKMAFFDTETDLSEAGISDEQLSNIIDKVHDQFEEIFNIFYPHR
ncbi:HDOD domain-containing protein [Methylotuvimicrobium buryatense]|nr:HDOD domain-containing protein [Methylotuvimicrobium buryatense]